ncbi:MAG: FG-GAP-like repeat-containing protein [Planctomycetota bacterium]|nr:FG-GAP-like repeat-containing protein [Planctomycetota bacterium]
MHVVNLDGDDDLDILLGKGSFRLITNDGSRQFSLSSIGTDLTSTTVQKAKAVDLNGDGFLDLVGLGGGQAFNPRNDRSGIVVRLSDGAGGFQAGMAFNAGGQTQDGFAIVDFNLDGHLDVVTSTDADSTVSVLLGDGTGSFGAAEHFNIRSGSESSLAVGDIDRDGDPDIVTPSFDTRSVTLLFNHTVSPCEEQSCHQTFEYDADFSQLTRNIDELGRQQLFEIDPATGNTLRETIVLGQPDVTSLETDDLVTQFTYTPQGLLDTSTDPLGRVTDFDYDALGRLASITFAVGTADEAVRSFEYDAAGNQAAEIDEANQRTEFEYDALNRLVLIRDALNAETKFTYDANGNVLSTRDELDQPTRFEYDTMNRLVKQIDAVDNFSTFEYDGFGNLTRQVDRLGRDTQFRYDARNRLVETINAEGGRSLFQYDADSNVVAATDENRNTMRLAYDQRALLTHQVDALNGLTRFQYDSVSNLVSTADQLGRRSDFAYDDADRMIEMRLPDPDTSGPIARPRQQFVYDKAGNTRFVTDPLGNTTESVYDNRDRRVRMITPDPDSAGPLAAPEIVFAYDDRSLITAMTDPLGRVTQFEYDELQRLTRQILPDPDGADPDAAPILSRSYDAFGNLTSQSDALGNVMDFEYDTLNRLVRVIEPDSDDDGPQSRPTTTFTYDAVGQVTATTDAEGHTTLSQYDRLGRIVRIVEPDPDGEGPLPAPVMQLTYDPFGNRSSGIDALGNEASFEYDSLHRLTRIVLPDPDGEGPLLAPISTFTYDAASQLLSVADPLERITTFQFDNLGRMIGQVDPDPDTSGPESSPVTVRQFDLIGNVVALMDPLGNTTTFEYDNLYRSIRRTDPDPDGMGPLAAPLTTYEYDAANRLLTVTDPLNRTTAFQYDDLDRLIREVMPDPDGAGLQVSPERAMRYDLLGNLLAVEDALDHRTTFAYDNLHRVIEETDAIGGMTQYAYDLVGNLLSLTDPVLNKTTWQYDALDRIVTETNHLDDSRHFVYDAEDNLVERIDRNGRVIQYEYDGLLRRTQERWLDGGNAVRTFDYTFDVASQLLTAVDDAASYAYQYDALGRSTSTTHRIAGLSPAITTTRSFDIADNRTQLAVQIGASDDFVNDYSYDDLYRLTQLAQHGTATGNAVAPKRIDMTYDIASQMETATRFADLAGTQFVASSTYAFDLVGRLTALTHVKDAITLADYEWVWDEGNRITQFSSSQDGTVDYNHDDRNQLTGANYDFQDDLAFTYDANGNRKNSGHIVGANNRLLADGTFTYDYDGEGNLIKRTSTVDGSVTEYAWDHRNRLIRVTERTTEGGAATKVVRHEYDYLNRWVATFVDADGGGPQGESQRYFVYDGTQIILDFAGPDATDLSHRYLWGEAVDQLFADETIDDLAAPGQTLWTLTDHLGTIRDLVQYDANSNTTTIANHRVFDAFGNITSQTNAAIGTLFAFTGRPFDQETNLQYNLNRWYDATTGRWMSEDPIGFLAGDGNLNRYVGNQALDRTDSDGLRPVSDLQGGSDLAGNRLRSLQPAETGGYIKIPDVIVDIVTSEAAQKTFGILQAIGGSLQVPGGIIVASAAGGPLGLAFGLYLIASGIDDFQSGVRTALGEVGVRNVKTLALDTVFSEKTSDSISTVLTIYNVGKSVKEIVKFCKGKLAKSSKNTPKTRGDAQTNGGVDDSLEVIDLDDSVRNTFDESVPRLKTIELDDTPSVNNVPPKVRSTTSSISKVDPIKPQKFQNPDFYNGERVRYHYTNSPIDDFKDGLRANTSVTNDPFLGKKATQLGIDAPDKVLIIRDKGKFDAVSNGGVGEGTRGISSAGDFASTNTIPAADIVGFFEINPVTK